MKVVILAAGLGSRLGDANLPKPLTLLSNGKSILGNMVDHLTRFVAADDIYVVVGFRKEMIMEAFPQLAFIFNPCFAKENTSKSLLRAINKFHDDVLWINGDVVFHYSVLEKVFANPSTQSGMVVNVGQVGEEEVKYRTDNNGIILEVSKQVQKPQGEALGINYFSASDLDKLKESLAKCQDNDYFEKGIETAIHEGVKVVAIPIDSHLCTEVDFPEDLLRANRIGQKDI